MLISETKGSKLHSKLPEPNEQLQKSLAINPPQKLSLSHWGFIRWYFFQAADV